MRRRSIYAALFTAVLLTSTAPTIATADKYPSGYLSISPAVLHQDEIANFTVHGDCTRISNIYLTLGMYSKINEDLSGEIHVGSAWPGHYTATIACGWGETGLVTYTAGFTIVGDQPPPPPDEDPYHVSILPRSARLGQKVTIEVYGSCYGGLRIVSPVLNIGQLVQESQYEYQASATVNADVKPGHYELTALCTYALMPPRTAALTTKFTITKASAPSSNAPPAVRQVKQLPRGAAQTGGGGTAGPD